MTKRDKEFFQTTNGYTRNKRYLNNVADAILERDDYFVGTRSIDKIGLTANSSWCEIWGIKSRDSRFYPGHKSRLQKHTRRIRSRRNKNVAM